ncbi:MAG: hypothetical protein IIC33_04875 [Chloroflexi bacterium]|nr:hypothetical protein [Chloroflexota bacterium]
MTPGESINVQITFDPLDSGTFAATLTFNSNAPNTSGIIPLTGFELSPFGDLRLDVSNSIAPVLLQTLSLIGGSLTDVARDGTMLFTMTSNNELTAVDTSAFLMLARDSLTLPNGGGRLFVGSDIAYVAAQNAARGGYVTANVSDPDNLTLISGTDVPAANIVPKTAIVANGSGLGTSGPVTAECSTTWLGVYLTPGTTNPSLQPVPPGRPIARFEKQEFLPMWTPLRP